ncbi:MAG TPA: hypothetical protein VD905_16880 [Flavobacteriales bacterium]|nr:hypothetical protein [Flavobacteriales bacterium]
MKIKGIEGMTVAEVQDEINRGGKFVLYTYCISVIVMSFKRPSSIYFIKSNENAFVKGLPFSLTSLLLGWWGIPWGIIYTFGCLFSNIGGGKNVTTEVMQSIQQSTGGHVFEFETAETLAQ